MVETPKARFIAVIFAVIVVLMVNGCGKKGSAQDQSKAGAPEVSVVVIKREQVPLIAELPGRISPYLVAEVRPQVTGIIQKRHFTEGSDVKADEALYLIDPAPYRATYNNARAALTKAEASLPSVRQRVDRYKELISINAVSQQEYDDVSALLNQVEAEIEYWKAAVEAAQINLGYTNITAPIGGRIGKSNVTVGALVTAGQPLPLAVIQQLDPIYVDATQSSADLLRLKGHMASGRVRGADSEQTEARLILEEGTTYARKGSLKFSDVTVDSGTGSYMLRMVFPNPKCLLLPGMYVRALIQEGVVTDAILAPQQGVFRDPKGNPVSYIVDDKGAAQARILTLDQAIGDKWLVSSGLEPGDQFVVEGIQKLRSGIPVNVVPFDTGENAKPGAAEKKQAPPNRK